MKLYVSSSPKYVTTFRVLKLSDSIFGVPLNCDLIFGGQLQIADMDPV